MIDAREQVATALLTVCNNVTMAKPDGDVEFPLICYSQTSDLPVNVAYDRLRYRVAVYASTFADLLTMVAGVINVMSVTIGLTLTGETPDEEAHKGTDFYMKRLDFAGLVNKQTYGVLKGTT
jgi:hypothetical protein